MHTKEVSASVIAWPLYLIMHICTVVVFGNSNQVTVYRMIVSDPLHIPRPPPPSIHRPSRTRLIVIVLTAHH